MIGSEATLHFGGLGMDVVGIDNDMRAVFFGPAASTRPSLKRVEAKLGKNYTHLNLDVRDRGGIEEVFRRYGRSVGLVIHAAAQPSHDWAARDPFTDFDINAGGTLNLLEATRIHCGDVPFIFLSTNKVYGDTPNRLPLVEEKTRYELDPGHAYWAGIREDMPIDRCLHSLFGASKAGADLLVQEYGRYFEVPTTCFRGGTLTGPHHSAVELHGFLAYLIKCTMSGLKYTVFGYKGKQVRDTIHSADLIAAFDCVWKNPRAGAVYNIGGGREISCSVLEAIAIVQELTGSELEWQYDDTARIGDHQWWIGSNSSFERDYPEWSLTHSFHSIVHDIASENSDHWRRA